MGRAWWRLHTVRRGRPSRDDEWRWIYSTLSILSFVTSPLLTPFDVFFLKNARLQLGKGNCILTLGTQCTRHCCLVEANFKPRWACPAVSLSGAEGGGRNGWGESAPWHSFVAVQPAECTVWRHMIACSHSRTVCTQVTAGRGARGMACDDCDSFFSFSPGLARECRGIQWTVQNCYHAHVGWALSRVLA